MRKLAVLSLVGVLLLASSSDVFARPGGGRGGGGRGGFGGRGGYYGGRGGYYGGRGGFYGGGGYWGDGLGWGLGLGYPYYGLGGVGYGYTPYYDGDYYATSPNYYDGGYYAAPTAQAMPTETRMSFYSDPNSAIVDVIVPNNDAQVWFDGTPTKQRGMDRIYTTPPLTRAGDYEIKAQWTENGQTITRQRTAHVQPGQMQRVDFRSPAGEALPTPKNISSK